MFTIQKSGRVYSTTFDPSDYASPAGNTYYVNPDATGSGDGSSFENGFTTIQAGLQASNASVLLLTSGYYTWRDSGWLNGSPAFVRNVALICPDGEAVLHTGEDDFAYNWSKTAGYTNIYQTAYNANTSAVDFTNKDSDGFDIPVKRVANAGSLAATLTAMDAEPNTSYFSGGVFYCHTFDSRVPDGTKQDIIIFRDKLNMYIQGNYEFYFENIKFLGGDYPFAYIVTDGAAAKVITKSCKFSAGLQGGSYMRDIDFFHFTDGFSKYNALDGFYERMNVHARQTKGVYFDCKSDKNGREVDLGAGGDSNDNNVNGFSAHDGCQIIRANCTAELNDGRNFGETHADTTIMWLGSYGGESSAVGQTTTDDAAFAISAGVSAWMENCQSGASYYGRVNGSSTLVDLGGYIDGSINGDSGTIT
jgi:hypothetical protein